MKPKKLLRTLWLGILSTCLIALFFVMTWRQSRKDLLLVSAIQEGDVARATTALQKGANPNAHEIYENTPGNPVEAIGWIFRSRAIVWHNSPVLHAACQSSQPVALAEILLKHGANPDGVSLLERTALLECIEQDKADLVSLLLKYGTNVNARTPQGDTALMLLAGNQFAGVRSLPVLIAHGANLNLRNEEGKTALQLARESHHAPAIKILQEAAAKE